MLGDERGYKGWNIKKGWRIVQLGLGHGPLNWCAFKYTKVKIANKVIKFEYHVGQSENDWKCCIDKHCTF